MKRLFLIAFAVLLAVSFNSCSKTYDNRLDKLEEAIESLNQNYKTYTPNQLKQEVDKCENLIDKIRQDESKLSIAQRKRFNRLARREAVVLGKIVLCRKFQDASSDFTEIIQYIKELLKARARALKDSTDSLDFLDSLDSLDSDKRIENSL